MTQRSQSTALIILLSAIVIIAIAFGTRQSFGLFMRPITEGFGWGRESLSLALAVQNVIIGFAAPISGAASDRFGPGRVLMAGGVIFSIGVYLMSVSTTPTTMLLAAGIFMGVGLSAVSMPVILGLIGRVAPEDKRSLWLGIGTGCATLGQLALIPVNQWIISSWDWTSALVFMSMLAAAIIPMAWIINRNGGNVADQRSTQSLREALVEARSHRGYVLLTIGFFVCGFHVAFLAAHLPAFIADRGMPASLGATALVLVAVFNMIGSWCSGYLGGKRSKKNLLVFIYLARAVVFTAFVLLPTTPTVVFLFAAIMGLLWLSTVPLTTGIIAQVFGTRYMSTLYGITFMSHQIGSFLGIWLGGRIFDATGSYEPVWWVGVALGITAAALHAPINDRPLARLTNPAAPNT